MEASGRGDYSFTPDQAYGALRRQLTREDASGPAALRVGAALFFAALALLCVALVLTQALRLHLLLVPLVPLALAAFMARSARRSLRRPPSRATFHAALRTWAQDRRDLRLIDGAGRLALPPGAHYRGAATTTPPPRDASAPGRRAVLVCERDELVDVLVDNGLDRECDLAIISERGYPDHALRAARARLERDPTCPIIYIASAPAPRRRARLDALGLPVDARPVITIPAGDRPGPAAPHELPYPALRELVLASLTVTAHG